MALQVKNLGSHMGMDPGAVEACGSGQISKDLRQIMFAQPKLAVDLSGANVFVGMDINARIDPHHHPSRSLRIGDLGQSLQLIQTIRHHGAACFPGHPQLICCLAVAMQIDVGPSCPRLQGGIELTTGGHIQPQPLLAHQPTQGQIAPSFAGIDHLTGSLINLPEGIPIELTTEPQRGFIHDVEGRRKPGHQIHDATAADLHLALGIGAGGEGGEGLVGRAFEGDRT